MIICFFVINFRLIIHIFANGFPVILFYPYIALNPMPTANINLEYFYIS
jgi:hypothetical protein